MKIIIHRCIFIMKLNITMDDFDGINRCVICGVDLGECNPRQYCCKTYCPFEIDQDENDNNTNDQATDKK